MQDVYPTLLAAANVERGTEPMLDGVDRWPQIRGADPVDAGEIFFGVNGVLGRQEALRLERWKLVRTVGFEGDPTTVQLFDVESDPRERVDRASDEPDRLVDLQARLDRWLALQPPGSAQGVHWPHPGWMPPADYNAAVRDDEIVSPTLH